MMQSYEDYWFNSQDGLRLYARDYHARDYIGKNAKKFAYHTLVCISGLTRNSADFSELAEQLSDRFRVIVVDLRGRGRSDYDDNPLNYHPGTYVQDVISLLDTLELDSAIFIGTSLGGLVSMFLAAMQPDRVTAMVINDIGPDIEAAGMDRIKAYVSDTPKPSSWQEAVGITRKTLAREFPLFTEDEWQSFTRKLFRENSHGIPVLDYDPGVSVLLLKNQEVAPDLWPLFSTLKAIPLLVLRGELSDILSMACVEKMMQIHQNMQFREVPNCGHAPLLTEPESVTAINTFLDSI